MAEDEQQVDLRHVFAGLIQTELQEGIANAAVKIEAYAQRELIAHARHAAALGCKECEQAVAQYRHLIETGDASDLREMMDLFDSLTSHMTLEDDLDTNRG